MTPITTNRTSGSHSKPPQRRTYARTLVLRLQPDLLERHDLVRHAVLRLVHHAVRPLPDLLQLLVPLHFGLLLLWDGGVVWV